MKLLQVDSSILGDNSVSRVVTREIVERWKKAVPGLTVDHLDLAAAPLPHFSIQSLVAGTEAQADDAAVLHRFLQSDVVVVGAPMYNFNIPTQLKSWIDRLLVAGKTFRYGPNGPEGLVKGKTVIVAVSRGGVYQAGGPAEHVETYLKAAFNFIGVEPQFVRADGIAMGPEARQKGLDTALAAIPVARAA